MRVQKSTDWDRVSLPLLSQMHAAPQNTRKDLARLLGHVTGFVMELSREEVELRRTKKQTSPKREKLLVDIEDSINEYEKWLLLAYLQHG